MLPKLSARATSTATSVFVHQFGDGIGLIEGEWEPPAGTSFVLYSNVKCLMLFAEEAAGEHSLDNLKASIARLEKEWRDKGKTVSGRILCVPLSRINERLDEGQIGLSYLALSMRLGHVRDICKCRQSSTRRDSPRRCCRQSSRTAFSCRSIDPTSTRCGLQVYSSRGIASNAR